MKKARGMVDAAGTGARVRSPLGLQNWRKSGSRLRRGRGAAHQEGLRRGWNGNLPPEGSVSGDGSDALQRRFRLPPLGAGLVFRACDWEPLRAVGSRTAPPSAPCSWPISGGRGLGNPTGFMTSGSKVFFLASDGSQKPVALGHRRNCEQTQRLLARSSKASTEAQAWT